MCKSPKTELDISILVQKKHIWMYGTVPTWSLVDARSLLWLDYTGEPRSWLEPGTIYPTFCGVVGPFPNIIYKYNESNLCVKCEVSARKAHSLWSRRA